MKKKLLFYCFLPLFFLFGLTISGKAQLLLDENFDYPVGDSIGAHGWKTHSGGTTNTVKVVAASITYPGYLSSGIGNEVSLLASGADVNRTITPQSTGSVYVSFILNIKTATLTGDYFFHFGQTVMGTTFKGKLFVKSNASNKIAFGTSFGSNTGNYTTFDYDLNTVYLVVVKYSLNSGSSTDDQISVFINPVLGNAEPAPTVSNIDTPVEIASVGSIALRQGNSSNAPTLLIDGIRVGSTWVDVNPAAADVTPPSFTATPTNGDIDVAINAPIVLTFDEAIRNIDDSEITDANVASLLTLKETDASGAAVPFTATIDATKTIITATPITALANSQVYYAAIAPVEDAADNAAVMSSMTFTTVASTTPIIGDVAITETAPYLAGDLVTITWTSANVTNVLIEAWIPSETKWDVLFASTASDGTETFTIPANAQYSAEYKLRISDIANPLITAESAVFTVIAVVNDLASLRAQPANAIVKYTGIATVTYARTARNQKYLQDATAAILIDDPTPAPGFITGTYNIGNGITNIVGKILFFNQLMEFTPLSLTGEPATGIEIVPEVRTLASLTPADQSKLIKIQDFAFKTPTQFDVDGKFVAGKSYDIDGVDKTVMAFRTAFAESDYIGGFVPAGPISSIVLVGQFNTLMQITPRSWSDMTVPTVAAFDATPTFALEGETVQFTDMSTNNPVSWEWTFVGGSPATSTEQNPLITYPTKGTYAVTLKATNASGGTNTITKTDYIIIGVTGISTLESAVKVYPNPTSDKLYISNPSNEKLEITILSSLGKHVKSMQASQGLTSVDLSDFPKGIYMIKMLNKTSRKMQTHKVLVK